MNEATEISARCANGQHRTGRPGCRSKSCQCECHKTQRAIVVRAREKRERPEKIVLHEPGCSKKPCVCSDIRAGRAAKRIVMGIGGLIFESLFGPAKAPKSTHVDGDRSIIKKDAGDV